MELYRVAHLALALVYLVAEEDEWLLDLHLRQIARHTQVRHTLYAVAHRLPAAMLPRLRREPNVILCDIPPTPLRSTKEHAYYMEALIRQAVVDGASHIACVHVDSFPLHSRWVTDLAARLDDHTAYVTLDGINTALLFFPRQFYLTYQPRFLPSNADLHSPEFAALQRTHDLQPHSGIGYALCAYRNGLGWHELPDTTTGGSSHSGRVYGGLFFHLARASWIRGARPNPLAGTRLAGWLARLSTWLIHRWRRGIRNRYLEWFHGRMLRLQIEPDFRAEYAALKRDPQAYLAARMGQPPESQP